MVPRSKVVQVWPVFQSRAALPAARNCVASSAPWAPAHAARACRWGRSARRRRPRAAPAPARRPRRQRRAGSATASASPPMPPPMMRIFPGKGMRDNNGHPSSVANGGRCAHQQGMVSLPRSTHRSRARRRYATADGYLDRKEGLWVPAFAGTTGRMTRASVSYLVPWQVEVKSRTRCAGWRRDWNFPSMSSVGTAITAAGECPASAESGVLRRLAHRDRTGGRQKAWAR